MDINALMKLSYGLYVAGTRDGERMMGCIVDAVMQATVMPPVIVMSCIRKNHTTEVIRETGAFTLSVLPRDVEPFFIANFGFQSSRKTDKWANVPYDLSEGLPVLRDCVAYARCRVEQTMELSTHTLLISRVEDAWLGTGEPLIYGTYLKHMKKDTMKAFKTFQATGQKPERVTMGAGEALPVSDPEGKSAWR